MNAEEKRAYQRGYAAGLRRKKRLISAEVARRERQAFLDKAFLAALPACIEAQGWKTGDGKPITTRDDRIRLARGFAIEALRQRPEP